MLLFKRSALAILTTAALASAAHANVYSNVIVFGDSLSDGGIYGSRFTTNPGLTAAEYFAQDMGYTLTTSTTGGTNYAQGGANVATSSSLTPAGFVQRPVSTQITEYLTKTGGVADPNAIYVIQGGANDIFQATGSASIIAAGSAFVGQVIALSSAGAKYIVVPNLPNLGATPAFAGSSAAPAVILGYNRILKLGIEN